MPFTITLDSAGDGSATKLLGSDIIIGVPVAYKEGQIETKEFFALYVYTRRYQSTEVTGSGTGQGGGTGQAQILSPPTLMGTIFRKDDELVVKIEAGVDNAAGIYHVIIPYQVVKE